MKNANILIVDGRIDLMEPFREIFDRRGYSVTMVEDGDKAIWLLNRRNFDVLLTPLQLPGASGQWDFRAVKRLCPSMAVIVVNSVGERKDMVEIAESKIEAVVDKPFNVKKLVDTVELILEAPLILIVDNKIQEWEALKNILADRKYRAFVAESVDEATEMIRKNNFDIVFLDAGMAGTNSVEVLETVKKIKPGIQVVMMIDYSSLRLVGDLIKRGAYTCLYKPLLYKERLVKVIGELQSRKTTYPARIDNESPHS